MTYFRFPSPAQRRVAVHRQLFFFVKILSGDSSAIPETKIMNIVAEKRVSCGYSLLSDTIKDNVLRKKQ